jgi:hypothetical protein
MARILVSHSYETRWRGGEVNKDPTVSEIGWIGIAEKVDNRSRRERSLRTNLTICPKRVGLGEIEHCRYP